MRNILLEGNRLKYNFYIPKSMTKRNFGQCSLDFNKLVIKAKIHAKTLFFGVYIKKKHYDLLAFETLGRMHKNIFFFFSKFFVFWKF
jgi:hypothetical protein